MKKSAAVPASLLIVTASAFTTGCGERRRCVDQNGNLLPREQCERGTGTYYGGYGRTAIVPRWVYGGTYSNGRVMNFSTTPRGGFGSSGFMSGS